MVCRHRAEAGAKNGVESVRKNASDESKYEAKTSSNGKHFFNLLAANKRIVNLGLELMGARTLQRLSAENDARAHLAPGTARFRQNAKEKGLKAALAARDADFGDGRARVSGPEIRDDNGFLIDL